METWKKIDGYEKYYISDDGKVKSVYVDGKEFIHKERLNVDGYVKATLTKHSKAKDYRVHRLVARYFIPNLKQLETVNHIDGNKTNNNVKNLEWMTRTEQMYHAYELGLKQPVAGEKNGNAVLTNEQAKEIRKQYIKGSKTHSARAISEKYNVSRSVIQKIVSNKTYIK